MAMGAAAGGAGGATAASSSSSSSSSCLGGSRFVRLRPNLVRGHHFECVPREAYGALTCWYGERTPSICRRAAPDTAPAPAPASSSSPAGQDEGGRMRLVLYPELQGTAIVGWGDPRAAAGGPPRSRCAACRAPGASLRCVRCRSARYCRRECQVGHWPYHRAECRGWSGTKAEARDGTYDDDHRDLACRGRVGLNNLGNTCFMNSALQCLSHSAPLTRYFLSNRFKADLNPDNPLGTGGKLATAYEAMVKEVWMRGPRKKAASFSPTALKRAIATYAPRFAGTSQHDSHEFLAYLLDALHEDLNRVRERPYVEIPNAVPGMKLSIAGAIAWDAFRRRNDSLVMDIFYGQFKSKCICPRCDRISITYDPFKEVSLEIPQMQNLTRVLKVALFRLAKRGEDAVPVTNFGMILRRSGSVADAKDELSKVCGIPPARLALIEVWRASFTEILQDDVKLDRIDPNDDIYAYEIDPYNGPSVHAVVSHRRHIDESAESGGIPFLTSFSAALTCQEIWDHIWEQLRRWMPQASDEAEQKLKALLKIRVRDSDGLPVQLFREDTMEEAAASLISPASQVKIVDLLGQRGIETFLFLSCEWIDDRASGLEALNFDVSEDHSSLPFAQEKQMKMLESRNVTLDQCFDNFTRPERLDENNMWFCSECKEHVRAMKTMELWRLPNVLVVHLKRFEYKNALRRDKLETFVDCPLEGLDMSHYCAHPNTNVPSSAATDGGNGGELDKNGEVADFVVDSIPAIYDLFGVVNHYGRMGFGHYTACARRWDETGMEREWALFDDSSVKDIGKGIGAAGTVVTPAAYVLFYRRRTFT